MGFGNRTKSYWYTYQNGAANASPAIPRWRGSCPLGIITKVESPLARRLRRPAGGRCMTRKPRTAPDEAGGIRERVLNAAVGILRAGGIQGLSQVQVARRARVRQSHLTYYFPRRHDLVEAVAVRFIDGIVGGLQEAAAGSAAESPGAMFQRVADAIADQAH